MSVKMDSFSSRLMLDTTLYRNQPGIANKVIAQAGYALTALVSAAETAAALAFSALSLIAYPFSSKPFEYSTKWLGSSGFSLGWSATNFFLNLFVARLVADEKSARQILRSGDLMMIPPGALI
jgi:hypothetical protein